MSQSQTKEDSSNILVSGLPSDFDEVRLRALFGVYGEVVSCKIMVDIDTGTSKGFGFVRYTKAADAAKAIEAMNGKKLSQSTTRALCVVLAHHDGMPTIAENERVYVRNLPVHVTEGDVRTTFGEFGEVAECKVLRHPPPDGRSKGVAFVRFKTVEAAQQAVARLQGARPFGSMNGTEYAKPLMVRFAESQEVRQQRHAKGLDGSLSLPPVPSPPSPTIITSPVMMMMPPSSPQQQIFWQDPQTGCVFAAPQQNMMSTSQPNMMSTSQPNIQLMPQNMIMPFPAFQGQQQPAQLSPPNMAGMTMGTWMYRV
jgi:RNA recognition motif-containing protein